MEICWWPISVLSKRSGVTSMCLNILKYFIRNKSNEDLERGTSHVYAVLRGDLSPAETWIPWNLNYYQKIPKTENFKFKYILGIFWSPVTETKFVKRLPRFEDRGLSGTKFYLGDCGDDTPSVWSGGRCSSPPSPPSSWSHNQRPDPLQSVLRSGKTQRIFLSRRSIPSSYLHWCSLVKYRGWWVVITSWQECEGVGRLWCRPRPPPAPWGASPGAGDAPGGLPSPLLQTGWPQYHNILDIAHKLFWHLLSGIFGANIFQYCLKNRFWQNQQTLMSENQTKTQDGQVFGFLTAYIRKFSWNI